MSHLNYEEEEEETQNKIYWGHERKTLFIYLYKKKKKREKNGNCISIEVFCGFAFFCYSLRIHDVSILSHLS